MQDVYLIYDIGKTNKKVLLFDTEGSVVDEYAEQFDEIQDHDGFACDDLNKIEDWVLGQYELIKANERYKIIGINFATYGASLVHVDDEGYPLTPLYNYLKPLPTEVEEAFLNTYFEGNKDLFALNTSSPFMGMLNSGLQLYWIKKQYPLLYKNINTSFHLPQFLSYLFSGKTVSDYSSVGCHTGLYNVNNKQYHSWVYAEKLDEKLSPLVQPEYFTNEDGVAIGIGLHDSSSALIPYLQQYKNPFVLISTGTWCINLNPFNQEPLTPEELTQDCLCYLQADGKAVKASRIFLGKEHEVQCNRIAAHFNIETDFYKSISFDDTLPVLNAQFFPMAMEGSGPKPELQTESWDLLKYDNEITAYHDLIYQLVSMLQISINLIDTEATQDFYIDGGFANNPLFIAYLKKTYPTKNIAVVGFAQATAYGAYLQLKELVDDSI